MLRLENPNKLPKFGAEVAALQISEITAAVLLLVRRFFLSIWSKGEEGVTLLWPQSETSLSPTQRRQEPASSPCQHIASGSCPREEQEWAEGAAWSAGQLLQVGWLFFFH